MSAKKIMQLAIRAYCPIIYTVYHKGKDQFGNTMVMSKVIRLMSKTDLVANCLSYFKEIGVPPPDRSTIFHYLAECFPGMHFQSILLSYLYHIIIKEPINEINITILKPNVQDN